MKKTAEYWLSFALSFLILAGVAAVIRRFGAGDSLMLWMLAGVFCSSVASDCTADKPKSETPK